MLDAVLAIVEYTVGMDEAGFRRDGKTCDAVLRRLEVLGEAAGRLMRAGTQPDSPAATLPLREIYDMRNALIHGYDGVDLGVVWQTRPAGHSGPAGGPGEDFGRHGTWLRRCRRKVMPRSRAG